MTKDSESTLRNRGKLSEENALVIAEYILAMKREVNPRLNYMKDTIQFLSELSRVVGIARKFREFTASESIKTERARKLVIKYRNGIVPITLTL